MVLVAGGGRGTLSDRSGLGTSAPPSATRSSPVTAAAFDDPELVATVLAAARVDISIVVQTMRIVKAGIGSMTGRVQAVVLLYAQNSAANTFRR